MVPCVGYKRQIWGHRLWHRQTPWLILLEFLLVADALQEQGVPFTDEEKEASKGKIIEAYNNVGGIYKEQLRNYDRSIETFEMLNKRFPGINTTYWQGTRSEIVTRTLTEFQGDQKTADVILSECAPVVLRAAGAIEPYDTVQASALLLHDPTLPTVSLQIMALSYNTKKLKNEDLPKSWEDVVNSKYKGGVALDDPLRAGPLSGLLAGFKEYWKDDAKWTRYIKGLKGLNVTVHKSTSAMFRLLIAGEYTIAMPALLHDVIEEKEKGSLIAVEATTLRL